MLMGNMLFIQERIFENHKDVFVNGALKLDGPTKKATSIMPYYTISWNQDIKNGKNKMTLEVLGSLMKAYPLLPWAEFVESNY